MSEGRRPQLDVAAGALTDWALLVLASLGAGLLIAAALRAKRWHWSWLAVAGLPLLPVAVALRERGLVALALGLLAGAAVAAAWQRRALERGGVEAQREREHGGPLRSIRSILRLRRVRGRRTVGGRFVVGKARGGGPLTVPFGSQQGVRAFIPGAPGSGKTVTMAAHAVAYAEAGQAVICVDPKGDRALRSHLRAAAARLERPFLEWTPSGPSTYNPLGLGSPSELADKVLAGEQFTEPHYLRQAQRYIGLALRVAHAHGHWPPSLADLVALMDPVRLEVSAEQCPDIELSEHVCSYLGALPDRSRRELSGVRDRIAVLCESELGAWLGSGAIAGGESAAPAAEIELERAIEEQAVVYVHLDSDRFPLAAEMLGVSLLVDLITLAAKLQRQDLRGLVIVDEFSALASDQITRLMSRSRSAGLSVLVGTQSLGDLDQAREGDATESVRKQLFSHVDYVVAHRQSDPEGAELLARFAGTAPQWVTTRKMGTFMGVLVPIDEGSRSRAREFVRHPDEFKRLGVGEAIVVEPASGRAAQVVRVWALQDPVAPIGVGRG